MKWHVKITIQCMESWDEAIFDLNMNEKKIDVNFDKFNGEWSMLMERSISSIISEFNLGEKMIEVMESM